jgi:hypothetical protein
MRKIVLISVVLIFLGLQAASANPLSLRLLEECAFSSDYGNMETRSLLLKMSM